MPDNAKTIRFEKLLSEFLDGTLDDAGKREFIGLLKAEASFTDSLVQQLTMDARLTQFETDSQQADRFAGTLAATLAAEADGDAFIDRVIQQVESDALSQADTKLTATRMWPVLAASVAATIMLAIGWAIGIWTSQAPEHLLVDQQVVARFTSLEDCRWMDPENRVSLGDSVQTEQRIELSSGSAELLFTTGARLTIVGPTIVEPRTDNSVFLRLGEVHLVAETPKSKGFTVVTPTSKFVDISTAFTARVSPDGLSHLNVSEGEVDVVLEGAAHSPRLRAGETLYVEPGERQVMTRIEEGDGTAEFQFPTIQPPSREDLADQALGRASIRVARGKLNFKSRRGTSGPASVLIDGAGQSHQDAPLESAFFDDGTSGSLLIDLGSVISISRINSYSWHQHHTNEEHRHRAQQRFTLYGYSGDELPDLTRSPSESGWTRIARVSSDRFFQVATPLDRPAQQASSITAAQGEIGRFRYLLWEVKYHTFFGELDVFGSPSNEIQN